MFSASLERSPDTEIVRYFDGTLTLRELDRLSDQFAVALADRGFEKGHRLATYLQNIPQVLIAVIGTWKAGGIVVSINPMSRTRELTTLLGDCEATALLAEEDLFGQVAAEVVPTIPSLRIAWTTSPLEYQTRHDPRLFASVERVRHEGTEDLTEVLAAVGDRKPEPVELGLDDVAFLGYTSGTTGPPKGAMNTHRNVVFNARTYRDWIQLGPEDSVLGVAPLFHITGRHRAPRDRPARPDPARARLPLRAPGGARRDPGAPADLLDRLDHGVHRADERPGRAARRPRRR